MMKKLLISGLVLCAALSAQAQTTYKLVWADEFESSVVTTNWNKEVTANPANNELQYYTSSSTNVKVENGNLVLTARRETKGDKKFTSGRVNSNGKVGFTHGAVVARIKIPKTKGGLWPAYWMMGDDISTKGWPYCGELDIVEWGNSGGFGGNEERYFSGAIHWGNDWTQHAYYSYPTINDYSVQDDYHTWMCVWDDNYMRCFLDDQQQPYFVADIGPDYGPYPYVHKTSHILFNLAVGGDFPGIWDPANITALPNEGSEAKMYIDWVRLYQIEGKENFSANKNDKDKVPAEAQTILVPKASGDLTEIPAAPKPTYAARYVRSLFCDVYTNRGNGSFFETWGSAGESVNTIKVADDDKVEQVKNFGYVGFNYNEGYTATSMSTMDYMHCDIYPEKDMRIGVTPITLGPNEYDEFYFDVKGGEWNAIDLRLDDFKEKNPNMDFSKAFQTKWFGGDGKSTIYIDNIFYYKKEATGLTPLANDSEDAMTYDLQGRRVNGTNHTNAPVIRNGKKYLNR